jgi:hypothetical protein
MRYGAPANVKDGDLTSQFNEGFDPPADARNKNKGEDGTALDPNDPYDAWSGKGQGDVQSEAGQRYEDHATLRMLARRTHNRDWVDRNGKVRGEDDPANASIDYQVWRKGQIDEILASGLNNNATNHSTIMTNADHAEKALAYDVAIGLCYLSDRDLKKIRLAADWRFLDGLDADDPGYPYIDYFQSGSMNDKSIASWVRSDRDANMPARIADIRDGMV